MNTVVNAATDPTLLALSCVLTTDLGVALFALSTCYLLWEYAASPSRGLLLALGVPESTVMEDYLLSNVYRAERNEQTIASLGSLMRDPELLRPVLEVRPAYLQASFDAIAELFGSAEVYVRDGLGIDDASLARLRANLLE